MSERGSTGVAPGLLGREVGGGAHHRADLGEVLVGVGGDGPGDAEVGHLHLAGRRDEDVAGLHVAVHDAVAVGEAEGGGDVGADVGGAVGVQRALGAEDLRQGAPVDVLHDDEVGAVGLAPVVDADDVGVVEVGGRRGLPPEALHEGGVGGELGEQDLHGDGPVEQLVAGEEHLGHAAAAEPAVQLVAAVEDGGPGVRHAGLRLVRACVDCHGPPPQPSRYAARTACAIGAATRPPVCSLAPGWPSTITATAMVGSPPSGPPKPMIQACERAGSVPSWAVPVLPPTSKPGTARRVAVPLDDAAHRLAHERRPWPVHGGGPHLGLVGVDDVAVGVAHVAEHVGRHHLAVVVGDGPGHHRHLQRRGGHLVLPDRRLGEGRQVVLEVGGEVRAGRRGEVDRHLLLKPNASAPLIIASAPVSTPIWAKAVLQDIRRISNSVPPQVEPPKFRIGRVVPGGCVGVALPGTRARRR